MGPGTMPQRNQDTNDYGQDSGLAGPPSFSSASDADIDPTPTLYSPTPRFYTHDPASSLGGASGSYSGGKDSYWGNQNSFPLGSDAYTPHVDPPRPRPHTSQQSQGRSNKSNVGLLFCLFLVTVMGILLGLWLSDAL